MRSEGHDSEHDTQRPADAQIHTTHRRCTIQERGLVAERHAGRVRRLIGAVDIRGHVGARFLRVTTLDGYRLDHCVEVALGVRGEIRHGLEEHQGGCSGNVGLTGRYVVGVSPVDQASRPLHCSGSARVDTSGPETELNSGGSVGILVHSCRVDCVFLLDGPDSLSVDGERESCGLPIDLWTYHLYSNVSDETGRQVRGLTV